MNVYQKDRRMDEYIDKMSHNTICVNLPNSPTVTQYTYLKTQELIFR